MQHALAVNMFVIVIMFEFYPWRMFSRFLHSFARLYINTCWDPLCCTDDITALRVTCCDNYNKKSLLTA